MTGAPSGTMQPTVPPYSALAPLPDVDRVLQRAAAVTAQLTVQVRAAALRPPVPALRELDVLDAGTADGAHVPAITSLAA